MSMFRFIPFVIVRNLIIAGALLLALLAGLAAPAFAAMTPPPVAAFAAPNLLQIVLVVLALEGLKSLARATRGIREKEIF